MSSRKWNETNRVWDDDRGLLDDAQIGRCARADAGDRLRSPIPTRMVSNGEYMPIAQTGDQRRVEARLRELADEGSRKLGIDRRRFLTSTAGTAAALIAMNEVFGRFFDIDPLEILVPEAYAQSGAPSDLFVFDDQLHLVRGSAGNAGAALRALAQGPSFGGSNPFNPEGLSDERGDVWGVWNPDLVGLPNEAANAQLVQFIKDVYLDSQITIGLLSNVTASVIDTDEGQGRAPRNVREALDGEILTAEQTAAARDFVNEISESTRMLAHGLLYVGRGNLDYIREQTERNEPDSWKGYNISNAAKVDNDPGSLMRPWRHDDEEVVYPTFELIESLYARQRATKPGFNNICVHKGLAPGPPDPERGHPADLPKAARDWPGLNFITYHACIQPAFFMHAALDEIQSGRLRDGVPDISWTTEYAQLVAPYSNCYAEIGTTWASSIVTFPTVAAHIMGQLMKYLGPDRIVFGSDSVWYGSPQWQVDAFWRFQIPEAMRERYGYPEITADDKRKILGLNSARLYGITATGATELSRYRPVPADFEQRMSPELKTLMEFPDYAADNMMRVRQRYAELGAEPDHLRYGWVRARA
jgi:uncharacterized protein